MSILSAQTLKSWLKGSVLFLTLAGLFFLFRALDFAHFDNQWVDEHIRSRGIQGILLYTGLVAVASALGFPRQILSFLGGYAFGALYGLLLSTLGTTLGCCLDFYYARLLGRSFISRVFAGRMVKLNAFISRSPFTLALIIRLLPVGSNAVTSLLAGISAIPAASFIAGSFIGYLPQNLIFAILGKGLRVDTFWRIALSASLFILASGLGYILYKRHTPPDVD